jgi:hypothetical protein
MAFMESAVNVSTEDEAVANSFYSHLHRGQEKARNIKDSTLWHTL